MEVKMSIFSKLFGKKSDSDSPASLSGQPVFIRKEQNNSGTYEIYKARDAESAKEFLMERDVKEKLYYIVVETPEGNWGMDMQGLYLEHLLPFQSNIESAESEGSMNLIPSMFSLQMAANGITDNFINTVECGKCNHQWQDGLRYQESTIVRCPKCKSLNKIDSSNLRIYR
jgi:hypothetical protein